MWYHVTLVLLAAVGALGGDPAPPSDPVLDQLNQDKDVLLRRAIGYIDELEPAYGNLKLQGRAMVERIDQDNPIPHAIQRMKALRDRARDGDFDALHQNLKLFVRKLVRLERDINRAREEAANEEARITEAEDETRHDKLALYNALTVRHNCDLHAQGEDGYVAFNNICYKLGTEVVDYDSARALCQAVDMELATVDSEDKDDFLELAIRQYGLVHTHDTYQYWIGASRGADDSFYWTHNNQPLSGGFTNWDEGEPNDVENNEDCLAYRADRNWNDIRCNYEQRYVCEFYFN